METVNKVIDSATQAIWGENSSQGQQQQQQQQHGSEPVSGVTGKGTKADPYDAGNRDEQPDAPATQTGGIDPSDKPASYAKSGKDNYQTSGSDYPTSGKQSRDDGASSSSQKGRTTTSELDSTTTNQGADKAEGEGEGEGDDESGDTTSKSSGSAKQNVSIEALQGPQGPPPEHYNTEGLVGEAKDGAAAGLGKDEVGKKGEAEIRQDNPATSSKPGKEDVSGKGSKVSHLKEKLHVGH
ncbi:hypothetical protein Plec18170_008800 [Paecilomyces lecythidis]